MTPGKHQLAYVHYFFSHQNQTPEKAKELPLQLCNFRNCSSVHSPTCNKLVIYDYISVKKSIVFATFELGAAQYIPVEIPVPSSDDL